MVQRITCQDSPVSMGSPSWPPQGWQPGAEGPGKGAYAPRPPPLPNLPCRIPADLQEPHSHMRPISPPPAPHTSGTRALMNSSCSAESFFTICMRHFRRGCGTGRQQSGPSVPPSPQKPPKASPGRSSPGVARPPSGGVGPLESAPSWRARRCSAGSPAGSSSGHLGGSARSGPRGPGGWHTPPPAHGRPSSVSRGSCSGKGYDGQGEKGGWADLPIHPPASTVTQASNIHRAATRAVTSPGGDPAKPALWSL